MRIRRLALWAAALLPLGAQAALIETSLNYNVTSTEDGITRPAVAQVTRRDDLGADRRPVVIQMPGWGGVGDVPAVRGGLMYANAGYIAVNIGLHETSAGFFNSDLAESAKGALDALCVQSYADCTAVILVGGSYGGTQTHPVVRYLRSVGTYDGSGGANAGRKVVGILSSDAGYTLHYDDPVDADATAYSIAMIENLGDTTFPVDGCDFDNCGARNRADYHSTAAGSQYVLSYCPAGGEHGTRQYANWDAWMLSAVKTMLHQHRGVPTFTGYTGPTISVSNQCTTLPPPPPPNPPRMLNISTRMQVLTGNDVMIGGFVIGGSMSKTIAIVATGPSLTAFGIQNPLANPTLSLVRSSDQATIAANDDWQAGANAAQLQTAGFAPTNPLESAILVNLPPGAYTAIVQGAGGGTGVGVVAVYELDGPTIPLTNISTRGRVLTGNDVMIGGFVITGSGPQTVAIVATGPSLAAFGIQNPLANPTLTLVRSSDQAILATNDDWQGGCPQVGVCGTPAQLTTAGFAPTNPLESAIYINLQPGAYTAILSGVGGGTGVGVIGVYKVN
jgi:hypothetical protein